MNENLKIVLQQTLKSTVNTIKWEGKWWHKRFTWLIETGKWIFIVLKNKVLCILVAMTHKYTPH